MYFEYGENEILYLKSKDRKLAEVKEDYEWSIITVILTANYLKSIVGVSAPIAV